MQYHGLKLDRFQRQALEAIDAGKSVLVSAPTGTGKTLIADYLVEDVLKEGGRSIYTAPIKALSNQKYREYVRLHGPDKVGIVTGDVVINREAPLRIMTTEILRNILLQGTGAEGQPQELGELKAVIFDELHFIDDPDRGTVWEEVLIYLPDSVRILGLSATLSNLDELAGWLSAVRQGPFGEVAVVLERKRAVPLRFLLANNNVGVIDPKEFDGAHRRWLKEMQRKKDHERPDERRGGRRGAAQKRGRGRGRKDEGGGKGAGRDMPTTRFFDLVRMLEPEDVPALFFMFSRRATEMCARDMAHEHEGFLKATERRQMRQCLDDFIASDPNVLQRRHEMMYLKGIAFHHAGLNVRLKSLVEELYEKRLIKLLFCTSTFALGINMPARTVIFEQLEKFNGEAVVPLTIRQFMQKAGRAGRRGMDTEGQVLVRMDFQDWPNQREHLERLMSDAPEPVQSSFNLSFHSVINLMQRFDEPTIKGLLDRSFLAWQRANRRESMLEELARQELQIERAEARQPDEIEQHKRERKVARLKRRLERERQWLWDQFQNKVSFLRLHRYLDNEGGFGVGARLLRKLQIEEIFITELIMAGVFESLSPEETFGLCAGLVQELPRKTFVHAELPPELEDRIEIITKIIAGDIVVAAKALAGGEPHCDPDMMALGCMWADGMDLAAIMRHVRSETDVSGDLVGAFRRAKDLVGQLRLVFWEDEPRQKALKAIMVAVSRDEVEAVG